MGILFLKNTLNAKKDTFNEMPLHLVTANGSQMLYMKHIYKNHDPSLLGIW